jgi:hypothetical protein
VKTPNIERRTPNAERVARRSFLQRSMFDVRRSMFPTQQ